MSVPVPLLRRARFWLAVSLACSGCNSLFGIDAPKHRDDSCDGVGDCPSGTRCVDGSCYATCEDRSCSDGHLCVDGVCRGGIQTGGDSAGGDSAGGDSAGGDSVGGDSAGGGSAGGDSAGGDSAGGDSVGGGSVGGDSAGGDSAGGQNPNGPLLGASGAPSLDPRCGNGQVDAGEQCDDGGLAEDDGCSSQCEVNANWQCQDSNPSLCDAICGDGVVVGVEALAGHCDDGNRQAGDGCNAGCLVEAGYSCSGTASKCQETCGNGELDPGEGCDDQNAGTGDGCAACAIESGFRCSNSHMPSSCADVNECLGNSPCPPTFTCNNTPGSFRCACAAGQELCGGACVDEQTDVKNCGGCGAVCVGSCAIGRCLLTLAADQPQTKGLAIDANNVYWTNFDSDQDCNLMKVGLLGGTPAVLSSVYAHPPSGAIFASATQIYWGTISVHLVEVYQVGLDGGPAELASWYIRPGAPGPIGGATVVADGGLYFSLDYQSLIYTSPLVPNSMATQFVTTEFPVQRLASASTTLYWTEASGTSGKVMKAFTWNSNNSTLLATDQNGAYGLAIDATTVYWTNRIRAGSIMKMPRTGGTATTLASEQDTPTAIVVDPANAYWTNTGAGTVMKIALSGGTPVAIATGLSSPTELAIDATSLYVLTGDGKVIKITPK